MISCDGIIGVVFCEFNTYIAGDLLITLTMLTGLLFLIGLIFRMPLEWLSILLVPIIIYFMSLTPRFYPVGALILLFVSFIIIKNFWFRPV